MGDVALASQYVGVSYLVSAGVSRGMRQKVWLVASRDLPITPFAVKLLGTRSDAEEVKYKNARLSR